MREDLQDVIPASLHTSNEMNPNQTFAFIHGSEPGIEVGHV